MSPEERNEQIGEQLRAKITSKFTASTFLAGFALTALMGEVSTLEQGVTSLSTFYPISMGAIVAAIYLFICAIIKLDELTMPKLFWPVPPQSQSAPSTDATILHHGDLWNLQQRMIFFWHRLTIVATITTAIAVIAMFVPPTLLKGGTAQISVIRECTFVAVLVGLAIAIIYCWCIAATARKRFGLLSLSD